MRYRLFWLLSLLFLFACQGEELLPTIAPPAEVVVPFSLPAGFKASPLPFEFERPTQFFIVENQLWVAQLNGGESDALGQVLRIDLATEERKVIVDNLDKPTGIALLAGSLWIATRAELLRMDPAEPESLEVVLTGLPNNGRSNGTLTVTPAGKLLYETSGTRRDVTSGRLWEYDPASGESTELASGLKNAYAHVYDDVGRLWITEIADGSIEDVPLPGEINLVRPGADFGWPRCYGRELAGADCGGVRAAVTILPINSTPTGIAISPFEPDTLLIPLWLTGELIRLPFQSSGDNAIGEPLPFISGLQNPQHIITTADGTIWLSEYGSGLIWEIWQG